LLSTAAVAVLLLAVGAGIYRKSLQAVAPPVYDAMSYYTKAALVWRALGSGKLVNPLSVEPVVRPPGTILLSGPVGFSADFRPFFFRSVFFPIVLFIAACWLVAQDRLRGPRAHWLIASACAALLTLPMFYHFEPSDILPASVYWGLVDAFLASVAAMATALLLLGARRRSLPLTALGTLAGAFTLMIKPSGLFVIPVIFWAWFVELLILRRPLHTSWRDDLSFRRYTRISGVVILVVVGLTVFACLRSPYLSRESLLFFANSQRLLREMYSRVSLASVTVPQLHTWLGWHWIAPFAIIVVSLLMRAVVSAARSRVEAQDLRLLGALVGLGGGVAWWIYLAGPSETRYVIPFVLVFIVITLPDILSRGASLPAWVLYPCYLTLAAPAVLLTLLLWSDRPPPFFQRLLGVTVAAGQFHDEVQIGNIVADAARALKRDLSVYTVEVSGPYGIVEAVGEYRELIEPKGNIFRAVRPVDWQRPPLIRRHELLTSDYVLFRPLGDAAEVNYWREAETIGSFDAETRAIRAWLTRAGTSDGFEVAYDGSLRLLRVVDLRAADRSFGAFFAQHRWRDVFESQNSESVVATRADIDEARTASAPGTVGVEFSGKFRLHGALRARASGGLELELLWEQLSAGEANCWVFIHALNARGKVVAQADHPLRAALRPGTVWRDKVVWSDQQVLGVSRLGIGVYEPGAGRLKADRGERDLNDTRLLIGLPR
jgi:hypothetical protein